MLKIFILDYVKTFDKTYTAYVTRDIVICELRGYAKNNNFQ